MHTHTLALILVAALFSAPISAQEIPKNGGQKIQLDYNDVELSALIETIAKLTGKNFIFDDRVRGRVTIVSPTRVTVEQAYAVFESVLKVKGFTAVPGPGGVMKIIPVRDAKEASLETVRGDRPSENRDLFVTRLIPLRYIDAAAIAATIKPLVSKDALLVAYPPTNTIILTDTKSNIRRLLSILEAIDIETHKEELAVIKVNHADAATLGEQVGQIYGGSVSGTATRTTRSSRRPAGAKAANPRTAPGTKPVRIITDSRTNSLLVLAPRDQLADIRELVRKLDVPVIGGGRIHVYYLEHADAEELSETLNSMLSGQRVSSAGGRGRGPAGAPGAPGGQPQAIRAAVTELAEGITMTADPATNSLVIQASKEAYGALVEVIAKLDIPRPQVLVEALIMEVDIQDNTELGFSGLLRIINGRTDMIFSTASGGDSLATTAAGVATGGLAPLIASVARQTFTTDSSGNPTSNGSFITGIIRASADDDNINIVSAPHVLTSDNEEAEIRIGNNIPIITSRVESAQGQNIGLSSSVNVERLDIGVTLRVTPQISEGDTLRLKIFQEITDVNQTLGETTGSAEDVGVSLTNRKIENTVVVEDGETVVIGGLIAENYEDNITKVPFFGDIPILGWAFKSEERKLRKTNLLVFLTPHIVRSGEELELETIRKREEFRSHAGETLALSRKERKKAEKLGIDPGRAKGRSPVRNAVLAHTERYPLERMLEIEAARADAQALGADVNDEPRFGIRAGVFSSEDRALETLTQLVDAGHDGTLVSGESDGIVIYEILLGPYDTLHEAESVAGVMRANYGMTPDLRVVGEPTSEPVLEEVPEESLEEANP